MRNTSVANKKTSGVRQYCGWLLLIIVLSWIFILWRWIHNRAQYLHQQSKYDDITLESLQLLNQTKYRIRSEWNHISKYINEWNNNTININKKSSSISHQNRNASIDIGNINRNNQNVVYEEGVHIIFSTDCKLFMDYQTLVLFHSAVMAGHKGPVTRIVSGCNKEKESYLSTLYKKLYPKYHVHFTPDFAYDPIKKIRYVYFNKPYGLKHWLEHANPPVGKDAIIALLDPDMILLRPFTAQIRGVDSLTRNIRSDELIDEVTRGKPAAAVYGLGAPWTKEKHKHFNKYEICEPDSPCLKTTTKFGERHYSVGPPYVLHRDDMHRIAESWCRYAPKVHKQYPELLAEMYAYSIAAAHENLPHLQLSNYMVSNIHMGDTEEGWPLIDALPDVCLPPENDIFFPGKPLPSVLHFCQTYRTGEMGWAKRRPQLLKIFTCSSPLLLEPHEGLGFLDYKVVDEEKTQIGTKSAKRNAFVICVTHRAVNAAVTYYKQQMCDPKSSNFEKTIKLEPVGGR